MRYPNTHRIIQMAALISTLFLSLVAGASAQDRADCTAASVLGAWGYTEAGTLILPTGAAPFAAVGKVTFDAAGNAIGTQTSSLAGRVSQDVVRGTYSVNADCAGTMTVGVYDESGTLLRTIGLAFVIDDNASETRAVVTSLVLPNGMSLPSVITLEARRLALTRRNFVRNLENEQ